jgi:hypothetical protein
MKSAIYPTNVPGAGVRLMARRRKVAFALLAMLSMAVLVIFLSVQLVYPSIVTSLMILAGTVYVYRTTDSDLTTLDKRIADAERGAAAEELVGALLDRLPANCHVLHDIPGRYGNLDHVVMRGDGAIFLIETKSHRQIVTENNAKKFSWQTHQNIFWLQDILEKELSMNVWIHAAITFTEAEVRIHRPLKGIAFLSVKSLSNWLTHTPGNRAVAQRLGTKLGGLVITLQTAPVRRWWSLR